MPLLPTMVINDNDVERLATLCIQRVEVEGIQAIDAVCASHPEHADKVRGILRQLARHGLLLERSARRARDEGQSLPRNRT